MLWNWSTIAGNLAFHRMATRERPGTASCSSCRRHYQLADHPVLLDNPILRGRQRRRQVDVLHFAAADEEAALSPEDRQLARLVWDGELTRRPGFRSSRQSADSDLNKSALSAVAPRAS